MYKKKQKSRKKEKKIKEKKEKLVAIDTFGIYRLQYYEKCYSAMIPTASRNTTFNGQRNPHVLCQHGGSSNSRACVMHALSLLFFFCIFIPKFTIAFQLGSDFFILLELVLYSFIWPLFV
jgi:hypothetical protein